MFCQTKYCLSFIKLKQASRITKGPLRGLDPNGKILTANSNYRTVSRPKTASVYQYSWCTAWGWLNKCTNEWMIGWDPNQHIFLYPSGCSLWEPGIPFLALPSNGDLKRFWKLSVYGYNQRRPLGLSSNLGRKFPLQHSWCILNSFFSSSHFAPEQYCHITKWQNK